MANTFIFDDDEPQGDLGGTPAPEPTEPDSQEPEAGEGNNRTFLIAAIVLGGIVLLSLVCMAVYALLILPGQKANAKMTEDANAVAFTQTAIVNQLATDVALYTPTLPPSETPTLAPTETPVVVFATSTATIEPTSDPATATVQALQTQLAVSQSTATAQADGGATGGTPARAAAGTQVTTTGTPGTAVAVAAAGTTGPGTPTATGQLAKTGFADEVGLPGLFILSILLVAVILVARRMRQTPLAH